MLHVPDLAVLLAFKIAQAGSIILRAFYPTPQRSLRVDLLTIILIVLVILLRGGGYTHGTHWGAGGGSSLRNILYLIAAVILIWLVLTLLGVVGSRGVAPRL